MQHLSVFCQKGVAGYYCGHNTIKKNYKVPINRSLKRVWTQIWNQYSMNDSFEIPVLFNKTELSFPARLLQQGYTHKLLVEVNELKIIFEPDEEGNYRAIIDDILLEKADKINVPLLKTIGAAIESILR